MPCSSLGHCHVTKTTDWSKNSLFQMNLYNKLFISFFISLAVCSTFERKVNFEIPKIFTISTFPFRDSDLLFHNASCLSKSRSGGSKLKILGIYIGHNKEEEKFGAFFSLFYPFNS